MDTLNLQVLVNLSGGFGSRLEQGIVNIRESPVPDRMVFFANLNFGRGVYPGFGKDAAEQLEKDVAAGAVGTEVFQELRYRRPGRERRAGFRSTILSSTPCSRCALVWIFRSSSMSVSRPSSTSRSIGLTSGGSSSRCSRTGGCRRASNPGFDEMMAERGPAVCQASEHAIHCGTLRVARQRPRSAR